MKYIIDYEVKHGNEKTLTAVLKMNKEIDTKGKGKKVLKSAIKKQLLEIVNRFENIQWIKINNITKIEELNPNNVLNKEEFQVFIEKHKK